MYEKTVEVKNKLGLHARPASLIVQTVNQFKSDVHLCKDTTTANGCSIMSVMMLAAEKGSTLTIRAEGEDENQAVDTVANLFEAGFNED